MKLTKKLLFLLLLGVQSLPLSAAVHVTATACSADQEVLYDKEAGEETEEEEEPDCE